MRPSDLVERNVTPETIAEALKLLAYADWGFGMSGARVEMSRVDPASMLVGRAARLRGTTHQYCASRRASLIMSAVPERRTKILPQTALTLRMSTRRSSSGSSRT